MQLTTITLEASSNTIGIGGISVIWAICKDQNNNTMTCPTLIWSIDDSAMANLEPSSNTFSCIVTGKSNGSANITVSSGEITSDAATITITGSSLQSIEINPKTINIDAGKTIFFSAICKDNNGIIICPTLTWNSSHPLVGTIDQTGIFTGYYGGTTEITAFSEGKTSNTALITVSPVSQINFKDILILSGLVIGATYMILRKL